MGAFDTGGYPRRYPALGAAVLAVLALAATPAGGGAMSLGPWSQQAKLTAWDGAADDWFARSVAIDGNTAVISGYLDDDGAPGAGSAYVFERAGAVWSPLAKLTASDPQDNAYFGHTVAISGDTIVIGATLADSGRGAAYVFAKPVSGWTTTTQTAKLRASDGIAGDFLGTGLGIDGGTIAVGARVHGGTGAAYVFTEPATGWVDGVETAKLTPAGGAGGDVFGQSAAISGDVIVVGAENADLPGAGNAGAAYVFVRPVGGWTAMTQTAKLIASDAGADDGLGLSVAVDGDTVVAGAHRADGAGAAYVYTKPTGGWADGVQTAKLTASDRSGWDGFGNSVSIDGQGIVAGAYLDDNAGGGNAGAAYVFEMPPGGWADATETDKLAPGGAGDTAGHWVDISGNSILIGSPLDDDVAPDAGAAYVFVPEPGLAAVLAFGAVGMLRRRRRPSRS